MRIKERRFSVPFSIFIEDMTGECFRLLVFLLSEADFSGRCSPGYAKAKQVTGIGSDATISTLLRHLHKRGWIFERKRMNGANEVLWVQIPPRFRAKERAKKPVIVPLADFKK